MDLRVPILALLALAAIPSVHSQVDYHPLASFGADEVILSFGESVLLPVYVTNPQPTPDNIQVILSGTYPLARFDFECNPDDCSIPDENTLWVNNILPYENRTYYVNIPSADPGDYSLIMSAQNLTFNDVDACSLEVSYPAYFPDLSVPGMAIILALSALAYPALRRILAA